MEFAITVPVKATGTDDSWLPSGAGSFLFRAARGALSAMICGGSEQLCVSY